MTISVNVSKDGEEKCASSGQEFAIYFAQVDVSGQLTKIATHA